VTLGNEIAPGLRAWTRRYDEWKDDVSCFAIERAGELTLIDPLLGGEEDRRALAELAAGRDLHVVLTVHWHARSAPQVLADHPDARVWANSRARAAVARRAPVTDVFRPGDPLPAGLIAIAARPRTEVVLWDPESRALLVGDALVADGPPAQLRTCKPSWLPASTSAAELREALRPLLDLPVELVLPSHGPPVLSDAKAQLVRALAEPGG
jgi:glyoxylase-like metal-dependent hydrolase (beta-lactamase superfamily II)